MSKKRKVSNEDAPMPWKKRRRSSPEPPNLSKSPLMSPISHASEENTSEDSEVKQQITDSKSPENALSPENQQSPEIQFTNPAKVKSNKNTIHSASFTNDRLVHTVEEDNSSSPDHYSSCTPNSNRIQTKSPVPRRRATMAATSYYQSKDSPEIYKVQQFSCEKSSKTKNRRGTFVTKAYYVNQQKIDDVFPGNEMKLEEAEQPKNVLWTGIMLCLVALAVLSGYNSSQNSDETKIRFQMKRIFCWKNVVETEVKGLESQLETEMGNKIWRLESMGKAWDNVVRLVKTNEDTTFYWTDSGRVGLRSWLLCWDWWSYHKVVFWGVVGILASFIGVELGRRKLKEWEDENMDAERIQQYVKGCLLKYPNKFFSILDFQNHIQSKEGWEGSCSDSAFEKARMMVKKDKNIAVEKRIIDGRKREVWKWKV